MDSGRERRRVPPRRLVVVVVASSFALIAGAARADAFDDAMTKAGCNLCHARDGRLAGPSYKEVAAKYKGQDAAAMLVERIRKGGQGTWGSIPKPPTGTDRISDADLKAAVDAILAM
jgi:cytochrome c